MREIIIDGLTREDCVIAKKCLEGKTRFKFELKSIINECDYSLVVRTYMTNVRLRELYCCFIKFLLKIQTNSYIELELNCDEPEKIMVPKMKRVKHK